MIKPRWLVGLAGVALLILVHVVLAQHANWAVPPLALLDDLFVLAAAAGLLAVLTNLGQRALALLRPSPASLLEEGLLSLAVGQALAVLALALLGLAHLLTTPVIVAALIVAIAVGLPRGRGFLPGALPAIGRALWADVTPLVRRQPYLGLLLALGLAVAVPGLLQALAPPFENDTVAYHLTAPHLFLRAGMIYPRDDFGQFALPLGQEMLYAVALALGSDSVPQVLYWAYLLLTPLGLYACADRLGRPGAGLLAGGLYLLLPVVSAVAGWAGNDLSLTFCTVAAAIALLAWRATPTLAWALLAGLCCGMALASKTTGVGIVLVFALAPLACTAPRARWRDRLGAALALAGAAVLVASPWYLKNWRWFGSPLYPFSTAALVPHTAPGGVGPTGHRAPPGLGDVTLGAGHHLADYLTLPPRLLLQIEFTALPPVLFVAPVGLATCWLVARRLVGGARRDTPDGAALVAALAVGILCTWSLGPWNLRYLLPGLALACLAAGLLWDRAVLQRRRWTAPPWSTLVAALLLALGLQAAVFDAWGYLLFNRTPRAVALPPLAVVLGLQSRASFQGAALDVYGLSQDLNTRLPGGSCIVWHDPRVLYLDAAVAISPADLDLTAYTAVPRRAAPALEAWLSQWRRRVAPLDDACTRVASRPPLRAYTPLAGLSLVVVGPLAPTVGRR